MGVFEHIAKGLYVAGQLPLDAKAYFPTLTELKDLGISNYNAFTYYEWMRITCVETDSEFVWKEVDIAYTGGALDSNFQYPVDTLSNGIDYSSRYFNFVPYAVPSGGSEPIARPYVIYKHPNNPADYLEVEDVAEGFFGPGDFRKMVYKGGSVIDNTSWANIEKTNPGSYPVNT